MKIVESWNRGISDYTNNNGEADHLWRLCARKWRQILTRGSLVSVQSPGGEQPHRHNGRTYHGWYGKGRQDQWDGTNIDLSQSKNRGE